MECSEKSSARKIDTYACPLLSARYGDMARLLGGNPSNARGVSFSENSQDSTVAYCMESGAHCYPIGCFLFEKAEFNSSKRISAIVVEPKLYRQPIAGHDA